MAVSDCCRMARLSLVAIVLVDTFHCKTCAFNLECYGPGRGTILPAEENIGVGAMQFPNPDWSLRRSQSSSYVAGITSGYGLVITSAVLDDHQNPPLWAPNGRSLGASIPLRIPSHKLNTFYRLYFNRDGWQRHKFRSCGHSQLQASDHLAYRKVSYLVFTTYRKTGALRLFKKSSVNSIERRSVGTQSDKNGWKHLSRNSWRQRHQPTAAGCSN